VGRRLGGSWAAPGRCLGGSWTVLDGAGRCGRAYVGAVTDPDASSAPDAHPSNGPGSPADVPGSPTDGPLTTAVHVGNEPDEGTGAVRTPLVLANSYSLPYDPSQMSWSNTEVPFYTRNSGVNQIALQRKLA